MSYSQYNDITNIAELFSRLLVIETHIRKVRYTFGVLVTSTLIDASSVTQSQAEELETISNTLVPRESASPCKITDRLIQILLCSPSRCGTGRLQPKHSSCKRCRGIERHGYNHLPSRGKLRLLLNVSVDG